VATMGTVHGGDFLPAKRVILDNVRFDTLAGLPLWAVLMNYIADDGRNVIQSDEVYVYNHNGVAGDNFRVYYYQQAADFIVPQTGTNPHPERPLIGSPEAGLTNQENWDRYGIAIAGSIAPADVTVRDGISGFVLAI
jgi:hypothetical protein